MDQRKSLLLQLLLLLQAVLPIVAAWLLAAPVRDIAGKREGPLILSAMHGSSWGTIFLACLEIAARSLVPVTATMAGLWWLGQQKK